MRRLNHYRDKNFAISVANKTGGRFIDEEYTDEFGVYYIVIWD